MRVDQQFLEVVLGEEVVGGVFELGGEEGEICFEEIVFLEVVEDVLVVFLGGGDDLGYLWFALEEGGHFQGHHYF